MKTGTVHKFDRSPQGSGISSSSTGGYRQLYPNATTDSLTVAETTLRAFPDTKVQRGLRSALIIMVIMALVEFGASLGVQYRHAVDSFGQFSGNIFALVCVAGLTTATYWLIGVTWAGDGKPRKALAILMYAILLSWYVILLAPELTPLIKSLLTMGGGGPVFAGDTATSTTEVPRWMLYGFSTLGAFIVSTPGIMFIVAKFSRTKWESIRDTTVEAKDIRAKAQRADAHSTAAEEAQKTADHLTNPQLLQSTIRSALSNGRDQAIKMLQDMREDAVRIVNDGRIPNAQKAAAHDDIARYDMCIQAANKLSI